MAIKQLLIASFLFLGIKSEDPCPKLCTCSRGDSIARCSTLDPTIQRFSSEINNLVIRDQHLQVPFSLSNKIFVDLGLEHVRSIEIINSTLHKIDAGAFHGLKDVTDIDLSHNNIVVIPQDAFENNLELRRLKLSHNPIQINVGNYFLDSNYVTELDLSHCEITELSTSTFSRLKNIELLMLNNNKIKQIDSDVIKPMEFLDELNLSFNQITYISPDTFSDIEDLDTLHLKGNPISSLEELYLPDLRALDVSEGNLKALNPSSLEGVPRITYLNLSNNAIETIKSDAFSSLVDLMYLYLTNNDLRGPLPDDIFEFNRKLEILSLSGNRNLKMISGFRGEFSELYNFDISRCGLTEVNEKTFNGMHFLATLNVSHNSLQRLEPRTFSGLTELSVLDLSSNDLHSLPIKIFDSNHNLHKLYLNNNLFHHIPAGLFLPTKKLYSLDLSHCRLSYLWNASESIMMQNNGVLDSLVYLNVAGNRIKRLHLQNVVSLRKLGKLDVSANPLECSNGFLHTIEWLIVHHVIPSRGMGKHPISMTEEVNNNVQWDETVQTICPIMHKDATRNDVHKVFVSPRLSKHTNHFDLEMAPSESPSLDQVTLNKYDRLEDNKYIWPLTLVAFAGLCLIFALGNMAFLMLYKSRRNYRLVSYKSHFPNPIGGLSQLRHKSSPTYQKLYEECSVPKTPIVKNSQGKCVVTCIPDPDRAEAV